MQCPMCGKRWRVTNTTSGENSGLRQYLSKPVEPLVRWYVVDDYTARQRKCSSCKHTKVTVEIEASDLEGMLRHVAKNGLPESLDKTKFK
jgi:hypothetical protein